MRTGIILSITFLMLSPLLVQAASQITPRDGLVLSMPPDSVRCIFIRLPRDAGLPSPGNYIFTVSCSPGQEQSWADLSEQIVREISENNTFEVPICFSVGRNWPVGNCSSPYTITVRESYTGTVKEWHGGVCVSEFADADIVSPDSLKASSNVRDSLNDNTDIFSAWLEQPDMYTKPGESGSFNLTIQSNARLDIEALVQGDVTPTQARLSTSPDAPLAYREFSFTAPEDGTLQVTFRVSTADCQGRPFCTKFVTGTVHAGVTAPEGFTASLRPENIDIRRPEAVTMALKITNNQPEKASFSSSLSFSPADVQSGFSGETVEIGPYDSHTRAFVVTPNGSSKLYEVTALITSGTGSASVTSFITIDEMLTDATRQAEGLGAAGRQKLDSWASSHAGSEYGSDLQEYGSLRDALAQERQAQNASQGAYDWDEYRDYYYNQTGGKPGTDLTWIIVIGAAAGAGALAFLLVKSRNHKESQEYY